jgi:hypothetical protein
VFKKNSAQKLALSILLSFVLLTVPAVRAQTLPPEKLAAVISIINMYLLADRKPPIDQPSGFGVELVLGDLSPDTFDISENLYAQFDLQDQDVELCFFISSASTIDVGDLTLEVNGETRSIALGENCYSIPRHQQREVNYVNLVVSNASVSLNLTTLELLSSNQSQLALPRLTRGGWGDRAVRKVIKIFAFGGHATDAQIREWADMYPQDAIQEMLTFDEHNLKLSPIAASDPYRDTETGHGTLLAFQNYLSDEMSSYPVPVGNRSQYGVNGYNFDDGFGRMITVRGLNPFRQKIGYWETNYHLATNLDTEVSRHQMAVYYDEIMAAHEAGLPYHEVMGVAAKSAAVAMQYGHRRNRWVFDNDLGEFACDCNDDFAREIHQLFYGIFGEDDPNHEDGTIRETAKMLTDMPVYYNSGYDTFVTFETDQHHVADLTILGQTVTGANASEKIDSLMPISMNHPESLKNLPIMIISVLADDNLSAADRQVLRNSWASMGSNKNLLDFIHAYAISKVFHSSSQIKYLTSHERALYMANKTNFENIEAFFGGASYNGGDAGRSVGGLISDDNAGDFFRPLHNVFGAQSSFEAADSALAFENNYNELSDEEHHLRTRVSCGTCDLGQPWFKKWKDVLPKREDGRFYVADVAQWLWNHVVGTTSNYTDLEKAHLYSFLGAARNNPDQSSDGSEAFDFNFLMCMAEDYQRQESVTAVPLSTMLLGGNWDNYCRRGDDGVGGYSALEQESINRVWSRQSIESSSLAQSILSQLAETTIDLEASNGSNSGADVRENARQRVSTALGFIFTTPYVFAEGAK